VNFFSGSTDSGYRPSNDAAKLQRNNFWSQKQHINIYMLMRQNFKEFCYVAAQLGAEQLELSKETLQVMMVTFSIF
jgi:hypothetical protein